METAVRFQRGGHDYRVKHAVPSQNVFRLVTSRVMSVGMKINPGKTSVLCVSDALSFGLEAYIEDIEGLRIDSGDVMKLLGFHFSGRPTVHKHLEVLRHRFRARY